MEAEVLLREASELRAMAARLESLARRATPPVGASPAPVTLSREARDLRTDVLRELQNRDQPVGIAVLATAVRARRESVRSVAKLLAQEGLVVHAATGWAVVSPMVRTAEPAPSNGGVPKELESEPLGRGLELRAPCSRASHADSVWLTHDGREVCGTCHPAVVGAPA